SAPDQLGDHPGRDGHVEAPVVEAHPGLVREVSRETLGADALAEARQDALGRIAGGALGAGGGLISCAGFDHARRLPVRPRLADGPAASPRAARCRPARPGPPVDYSHLESFRTLTNRSRRRAAPGAEHRKTERLTSWLPGHTPAIGTFVCRPQSLAERCGRYHG